MENFIENKDWLGRGLSTYAFGWDHFLFIFVAISLGVLAAFLLKGKPRKVVKIVLISLWGFYVTLELFTYIYLYSHPDLHPFNIEENLPLHSCLMCMYIFPIAIFAKNKYVQTAACNFLVIINMIMGFITMFVGCPAPGCSPFSFFGFQTLAYHALDVIIPLIMLVTGYYDIKKNDVYLGLLVFGTLSTVVYIFDAITGCDYFYFYDGHKFPVFDFISKAVPHHTIWSLIVMASYVITAFVMHFAVIGIKYLINKHKKKPKEPQPTEN